MMTAKSPAYSGSMTWSFASIGSFIRKTKYRHLDRVDAQLRLQDEPDPVLDERTHSRVGRND
jgi:hypothetical protein